VIEQRKIWRKYFHWKIPTYAEKEKALAQRMEHKLKGTKDAKVLREKRLSDTNNIVSPTPLLTSIL
jgi:hypothetical protein